MTRVAIILSAVLAACSPEKAPEFPAESAESQALSGERTAYRRAVGGLGAGYLFQAHMSVGATADLFGRKVYAPEEVEALMETTIGMGDSVQSMLGEVRKLEMGPGDRRTVGRMLEVNQLILDQANALKVFVRRRTEENARTFQALRRRTWKRLEELFGKPDRE